MRTQTHHAIEEIAEERERQISEEGWTAAHDDTHDKGELAHAAAAYAHLDTRAPHQPLHPWVKLGKTRRQELVIAGALIVAELERLERLGQ